MTRNFRFFIMAGLLLLSVAAFAWFLYENHQSDAIHQTLTSTQAAVDMQRAELARDKLLVQKQGKSTGQKSIPVKRGEPDIIRELSKTSSQTGAVVQNLTFGTTQEKNTAGTQKNVVSVQVLLSGTTKQLLDFIYTVQANARLAIVNDCDLSTMSDKTQMNIQIYFPYAQG